MTLRGSGYGDPPMRKMHYEKKKSHIIHGSRVKRYHVWGECIDEDYEWNVPHIGYGRALWVMP